MQQLLNKKPRIDQKILAYLDQELTHFKDQQLAQPLFASLKEFIIRGKSVRGSLFLTYLEVANPSLYEQKQAELLQLAAALEIIHAGLLIHDDVIDQDEMRRGANSIWQIYRLQAEQAQYLDPIAYGKNQAICAGSICQYLANQLINQVENSSINTALISREIAKTYLAEMLDSQLAAAPSIPTTEVVLEMYHYKTALYTFGLPLKLAATLQQASTTTIKQLEKISSNIGLIFQIQDDIIGLLADEKTSGKPPLSDIREGKKTIVYLQLLENCAETEKTFLHNYFGQHKELSTQESGLIKQLISTKALPHLQTHIQRLASETRELINTLNETQTLRSFLEELLNFNLNRNN